MKCKLGLIKVRPFMEINWACNANDKFEGSITSQLKHNYCAWTIKPYINLILRLQVGYCNPECCNLSLGLATKARGLAKLWAKKKPGIHTTCSRECRKS